VANRPVGGDLPLAQVAQARSQIAQAPGDGPNLHWATASLPRPPGSNRLDNFIQDRPSASPTCSSRLSARGGRWSRPPAEPLHQACCRGRPSTWSWYGRRTYASRKSRRSRAGRAQPLEIAPQARVTQEGEEPRSRDDQAQAALIATQRAADAAQARSDGGCGGGPQDSGRCGTCPGGGKATTDATACEMSQPQAGNHKQHAPVASRSRHGSFVSTSRKLANQRAAAGGAGQLAKEHNLPPAGGTAVMPGETSNAGTVSRRGRRSADRGRDRLMDKPRT
jgi:hypothetical protein